MDAPEESNPSPSRWATLRGWFRPCVPDARRALALFGMAFIMGVVYVSTWGGPPEFWQQIFGPSVMMACGDGFVNPHLDDVPGLEDFLYLRAETFPCENIPADVQRLPSDTSAMDYDAVQDFHPEPQFKGWTQWQRFHRYLLMSVALCFYLFGVAWQSLVPLYGLLYGLTNALGYGLFRLAMGRRWATGFALLLMTSPVHLQQLPQLRDYSKAPFFFLIMLIMGCLLTRPLPLRLQLPLAALAGFVGGLGLGFRQDIAFAAAVFCLLVALFSPGHIKKTWWRRGLIITVFLAAIAVLGTPIVRVLSGVNNSTHDTIIGFTHYCDERLGVEAPLYDFGDPFLDEYVRAILMGYAHRTEGRTEVFRHYSPDYDAAGKAYFREVATTFPADLIVRGYASVLRIVDELQISSANSAPRGVTNQFVAQLYQWRQVLLDGIPGGGRYYVTAMLLVLGAINPRLALALFVAIMILAGYPALRFSERHAFHMEIVSLFALGFLLHGLYVAGTSGWKQRREFTWTAGLHATKGYVLRGAVVTVTLVALLLVPLYTARLWQSRQVAPLLDAYAQAERELVRTEVIPVDDTTVQMALPALVDRMEEQGPLPMYTEVLVLDFAPGDATLEIDFRYQADHPNFLVERSMTVPGRPQDTMATQLYYPLYYGQDARFQGIQLSKHAHERLRGIYRLVHIQEQGILLNAVLPPDWAKGPFYQQFSR